MRGKICPENELLAIFRTTTFEDKSGNRPEKKLELKSRIVLFSTTWDKSPDIWLLERWIYWMDEAPLPEPVWSSVHNSRTRKEWIGRDFCVFSHAGNFRPILQNSTSRYSNWNGGVQLEFTWKDKDVSYIHKPFNLESVVKCTSDMFPLKEVPPTPKSSKLDRSPRLFGRVPLINGLPPRNKYIKDDKFPMNVGRAMKGIEVKIKRF